MTELRGDYAPELLIMDDQIIAETDVLIAQMSVIQPCPHRCTYYNKDAGNRPFQDLQHTKLLGSSGMRSLAS